MPIFCRGLFLFGFSGPFFLFFFLPNPVAAQKPVTLSDRQDQYPLGPYLEILEDPKAEWTIEEVSSVEFSSRFYPNRQVVPNLGYTASAYWARFQLKNAAIEEHTWLLEVDYPPMDQIELYTSTPSGTYTMRKAGDLLPFDQREVRHRKFVFYLPADSAENRVVYLRFQSESAMTFPLTIWSPMAFAGKNYEEQYVLGFYYGIVCVMTFYNLFLFLSLRDPSYLYYILYISGYGLFQLSYNGLAYEWFWPSIPWWGNRSIPFFVSFASFWAFKFSSSFLLTKVHAPRVDRLFSVLMGFALVSMVLALFLRYSICTKLSTGIGLFGLLTICFSGIVCWRKKYRPARYFLIAWAGFLCGAFMLGLRNFGILQYNLFTLYGGQIGAALEAVLLSLGLADRINIIQKTEAAQRQLIRDMEKELQTAHELQMGLMPKESPLVAGFEIAGRCIPANHVGGDLFQYFQQDGKLSAILADVTGHAMEAAIPVVMFSGILKSQMEVGGTVEERFRRLNHSLHGALPGRTLVCLAMGELDPATRWFRYSNAGCPYPYRYQAVTGEVVELQMDAYPLGVRPDTTYQGAEIQLARGDRVVFCSDGIAEAGNTARELFGFERTAETIRRGCAEGLSAEALLERIIQEAQAFRGEAPQGDDQTIVVLKVDD